MCCSANGNGHKNLLLIVLYMLTKLVWQLSHQIKISFWKRRTFCKVSKILYGLHKNTPFLTINGSVLPSIFWVSIVMRFFNLSTSKSINKYCQMKWNNCAGMYPGTVHPFQWAKHMLSVNPVGEEVMWFSLAEAHL